MAVSTHAQYEFGQNQPGTTGSTSDGLQVAIRQHWHLFSVKCNDLNNAIAKTMQEYITRRESVSDGIVVISNTKSYRTVTELTPNHSCRGSKLHFLYFNVKTNLLFFTTFVKCFLLIINTKWFITTETIAFQFRSYWLIKLWLLDCWRRTFIFFSYFECRWLKFNSNVPSKFQLS